MISVHASTEAESGLRLRTVKTIDNKSFLLLLDAACLAEKQHMPI